MTELERQEKIKELIKLRMFYRNLLSKAELKLEQSIHETELEIDFYCDILQDIGMDLMKLGVDPLAD